MRPGKWCPERFLATTGVEIPINAHLVVSTNWKHKREFGSYSRCPERFLASQNLARATGVGIPINAHLVVLTNWKLKGGFGS